uniref:Uncharacterized protein n=1 Tax=Magnetococcus massalia (strain MO-1) TaxID=451514 RepID=A0A1S7LHF2_MAGMO|nr:protein of unknown function [include Beta-ketoacyl synthase N-terminal domain, Beta-ketoacyl synthase C-terminal domain, Phosphopantetheine attachment site, Condensation domain and Male sterility protein domain(relqted to NAD binding)] [Candidatus Magnetococcus massalia]
MSDQDSPPDYEPIAIIGMAGRLPHAENLTQFWQNLHAQKSPFEEIPKTRWDWQAFAGNPETQPGRTQVTQGGFITHVDRFDAALFGISPKEAAYMDPQQRLFLQTAWAAFEDAGYHLDNLGGRQVAVFAGVSTQDYRELLSQSGVEKNAFLATGMAGAMLANRVSYFFNLQGPSDISDTACSSALTALHRGVQAIHQDGCEMALVGGVNVILTPAATLALDHAGMLSHKEAMHAFDAQADGYLRSEGVGAVLLKPLAQAQAHGDPIHGVIRGSAVTHSGRSYSLVAPDLKGQARAVVAAYKAAGLSAAKTGYVEAHGVGSSMGDNVEFRALKRAFTQLGMPQGPCKISTVKNDVGHLEAASGMAALFKVLFALGEGIKPGLSRFSALNPLIKPQGTPFYWHSQHESWPVTDVPRRASLHSFGFSGVNAHLVVEQAPEPSPCGMASIQAPYPFLFSAKDEARLQVVAAQFLAWLHQHALPTQLRPVDVAYTLQCGRAAMANRLVICAHTLQELADRLQQWLTGAELEAPQGDMAAQATDWLQGKKVAWESLYPPASARCLSGLPSYPFAPTRCWLPEPVCDQKTSLSPMLVTEPQIEPSHGSRDWQEWLADQLQTLFGYVPEDLDVQHTFVELGLDSLSLAMLGNRLHQALGVRLSFATLAQHDTPAKLVTYLQGQGRPRSIQTEAAPPKAPLSLSFPLSVEQQRYWRNHQLCMPGEEKSLAVAAALKIQRPLKVETLQRALDTLIRHQSVLNTRFVQEQGEVKQCFRDLQPYELSRWQAEDEQATQRSIAQWAALSWDLQQGPLWHVGVIQQSESTLLLLSMHHIVADLRSLQLFFDQLSRYYLAWETGQGNPLPLHTHHYGDYVWLEARQRGAQTVSSPATTVEPPELQELELPFKPDGRRLLKNPAAQFTHPLAGSLPSKLKTFCRSQGQTPFTLYLATLHLLLRGQYGQQRMNIGLPLHNRQQGVWEELMGCFAKVSLVTLGSDQTMTVATLLDQCRDGVTTLLTHEPPNLSEYAEKIPNHPLVQVMLNHITLPDQSLFGAPVDYLPLGRSYLDFDLALTVVERSDQVLLNLEYAENLFSQQQVERLCKQFEQLLQGMINEPTASVAKLLGEVGLIPQRVVVAATFTADLLHSPLRYWMRTLEMPLHLQWAGFNQLFQNLLDPDSALRHNHHGVNVLLVRLADWFEAGVEKSLTEFIHALRRARQATQGAEYLLLLCPDSACPDLVCQNSTQQDSAADLLFAAFAEDPQVTIQSADALHTSYPMTEIHHPALDALGAIPYSVDYYNLLATVIARFCHRRHRSAAKVWVVDADQTLWRGVVGEDGPAGVEVDGARQLFQEKLLGVRASGAMLCLCSKNSVEDVEAVFDQRPEFPLKREDFVAMKVNWASKAENIQALAQELGLGLDSFIFVDDNPLELADVAAHFPQVLGLRMPSDEVQIQTFVQHLWLLDPPPITAEDRIRSDFYQQSSARSSWQEEAPSYGAFLQGLALEMDFQPLTPEQIPRVSQLSQRTNQFNSSGNRYSEQALHGLLGRDNHHVQTVTLKDRFGQYGLVGAIFITVAENCASVEALYLSCRALGRGVEYALLAKAGVYALQQRVGLVEVIYHPTVRNEPIARFLATLKARPEAGSPRFTAAYLADLTFDPQSHSAGTPVSTSPKAGGKQVAGGYPPPLYQHQQLELWLAAADMQAFAPRMQQGRSYPQPTADQGYVAPSTATEKQLAEIFAQIWGRRRISIYTPFYELGGSSLELVQILAEIRQQFDLPMPLQVVMDNSSIQRCAAQIDHYQQHGVFNGDIAPNASLYATMAQDAQLPQDLVEALAKAQDTHTCGEGILLTGATGFLGAYLLRSLLDAGEREIICLVRAENSTQALVRLQSNMARYNLWQGADKDYLQLLCGDFSQPQLGLETSRYNQLSKQIGTIYHNGAMVDFSLPYTALKAANVTGTLACLRLACHGSLKRFHHISTASVFDSEYFLTQEAVAETPLPEASLEVFGGYAQSKWVAERLVSAAAEAGLPAMIYRPNGIGPAQDINQTGFNLSDAFSQILLASLNMRRFFDLSLNVDFAPVDYVAQAVVALGRHAQNPPKIYALVNPNPTTLPQMLSQLRGLGEEISQLPYGQWLEALETYSVQIKDSRLLALLPLMKEPLNRRGESWLQMSLRRPRQECHHTLADLAGSGVDCPVMDDPFVMKLLLLSFVTLSYREQVEKIQRYRAPAKAVELKEGSISKPVLLLTWSLGEGHNAATQAIAAELKAEGRPYVAVDLAEKISFVSRLEGFWRHLSRHNLDLLHRYVELTQANQQHDLLWFRKIFQQTAKELVLAYQPSVVVAFCPLAAQLLRYLKDESPTLKGITCVTDWFGGSFKEWGDEGADWIYSPSVEATDHLLEHALVPEQLAPKIHTGSLIMRPGFEGGGGPAARDAARQRLNLGPKKKVLIVNAYGTTGPLTWLPDLPTHDPDLHILVLCYRNAQIMAHLEPMKAQFRGVLEGALWLDNLSDWLLAADVLFTKPGPGICAEAVMSGTLLWLNISEGIMPQEQSVYEALCAQCWGYSVATQANFIEAVAAWVDQSATYKQHRAALEAADLKNGRQLFYQHFKSMLP